MSKFSVVIINKNSFFCFMECIGSCELSLQENNEKPQNIQKILKESF